MMILQR